MLHKCAPGHTWEPKTHRIHVTYRGSAFRALPTAGKLSKGHLECGWVRKMARKLNIVDCANKALPVLAN